MLVLQNEGVVNAGVLDLNDGSSLLGNGSIVVPPDANNTLSGTIAPGIHIVDGSTKKALGEESPLLIRGDGFGQLTLQGNFILDGATTELAVGGPQSGAHDRLVIDGQVTLQQSTLRLRFVDGYAPRQGDVFSLLFAANLTGSFTEVVIEGLQPGFEFDLDPNGGAVVLTSLNDARSDFDPGDPVSDPAPSSGQLRLHGNQPNPFSAPTTITYEVPTSGSVQLTIYDVRGRRVRRLVDPMQPADSHEVIWDGRGEDDREQPSGVYLLRLRSGRRQASGKMTLVR